MRTTQHGKHQQPTWPTGSRANQSAILQKNFILNYATLLVPFYVFYTSNLSRINIKNIKIHLAQLPRSFTRSKINILEILGSDNIVDEKMDSKSDSEDSISEEFEYVNHRAQKQTTKNKDQDSEIC